MCLLAADSDTALSLPEAGRVPSLFPFRQATRRNGRLKTALRTLWRDPVGYAATLAPDVGATAPVRTDDVEREP